MTPIMAGGIIRWIVDKKKKSSEGDAGSGVLFCSGMIAGEGLVGVILAILAVVGVEGKIDLSKYVDLGSIGAIILLVVLCVLTYVFAIKKDKGSDSSEAKVEEE